MKLQLIKELSADGDEIRYNLWKVDDKGGRIQCVSCARNPEDGMRNYKEYIARVKELTNFKPEVIDETEL